MAIDATLGFVTLFAALAGAAATLILSGRRPPQATEDHAPRPVVLLFEDERLIDAEPEARRLLALSPGGGSDLHRLLGILTQGIPGLRSTILRARDGPPVEIPGGTLRLVTAGRRLRLELGSAPGAAPVPAPVAAALQRAIDAARAEADASPALLWRQDEAAVVWANRAYVAAGPDDDAPLFPHDALPLIEGPVIRLTAGDRTFDCVRRADGLFAALDATALSRAERRLRDLTRTLARTFAEIDIGLALFDERRRLVLFNPAFTDLFGVPVEALTRHPSMEDLFDMLREAGKVPEPRDYARWRDRLTRPDDAHRDLRQTWTLSEGQMLRVARRPHSDGAVAFLFQDITPEVTLTRRFRSELDTTAAVLDMLDDALAVVSPAGTVTLTNRAYARLWGTDPGTGFGHVSLADAVATWTAGCQPSSGLDRLRGCAGGLSGRRIDTTARRRDGQDLSCRVDPMAGGGSLIRFRPIPAPSAEPGDLVEGKTRIA